MVKLKLWLIIMLIVLINDNVLTTRSTTYECARILKESKIINTDIVGTDFFKHGAIHLTGAINFYDSKKSSVG